jgi:predicted  nucleic acid-binding Zn-ribbon protein
MAMPQNMQQSSDAKMPASQAAASQTSTAIMQRINEINTRVRLCEERINHDRERIRVFDDQILNDKKEVSKALADLSGEIIELRKTIKNIEDTIFHIIKELELTAKKQEISIIEKYVSMMDPTRYITKEEFHEKMKK